MASPTAVNDQITDSVTQANTKVLSEAPAEEVEQVLQKETHNTRHDDQVDATAQEAQAAQRKE